MFVYKQFLKEDLPNCPRPDVDLVFGTTGALGGIMYCDSTEFDSINVHDDQEGFLVLEGHGQFYADGEIVDVGPDMALLITCGVKHCFRKNPDSPDMKVFYFHAAN